jgi:hypothetical protein
MRPSSRSSLQKSCRGPQLLPCTALPRRQIQSVAHANRSLMDAHNNLTKNSLLPGRFLGQISISSVDGGHRRLCPLARHVTDAAPPSLAFFHCLNDRRQEGCQREPSGSPGGRVGSTCHGGAHAPNVEGEEQASLTAEENARDAHLAHLQISALAACSSAHRASCKPRPCS